MYLDTHNLTCEHGATLKFCYRMPLTYIGIINFDENKDDKLNTSGVVSNQMWDSEKAIRPLFANPKLQHVCM